MWVLLGVMFGLLCAAAPAALAAPTCMGHEATIVGTPGADILLGTAGRDVVVAGAGDDQVVAHEGNDLVCAGRGRDELILGNGRTGPVRDAVTSSS